MVALRNIRAKELGITELDGQPVSGGTFLTPFLTVLPPDFSWSLHWTQQAHRELLSRAGLGGIETEMTDKRPAPSFGLDLAVKLVYVDNEVFCCRDPVAVEAAGETAQTSLSAAGLPFHQIQKAVQNY